MPSMSVPTPTCSTPTASTSREMWSTLAGDVVPAISPDIGHGADDPARARDQPGVLDGDEARPAAAVLNIGVGEDDRLRGRLGHPAHDVQGSVSDIDHDAETIHLAHGCAAERREPTVHGRLGLDVAELVHPIVHELEGADPPVEGLLHAVHPAFET